MIYEVEQKYELTNQVVNFFGTIVYRIRALKDFKDVKKGDFGGYIQSYHNLSHEGNCWVYDEAIVLDDARVMDNAKVKNKAVVRDNAIIKDHAIVQNESLVGCEALIKNYAKVSDKAVVKGHMVICNIVRVSGYAYLKGSIVIEEDGDYVVFRNTWSSTGHFTYTFSDRMWDDGWFYGTSENLIKNAYKDSELSGKMYSLYVKLVEDMRRERVRYEV